VVLCYHAAAVSWIHDLSTEPALIGRQVEMLLRLGYRPATAREAAEQTDRRLLHVTFDDAYRSVPDAIDVLERLGVPASVYVCSAFADEGGPIPVRELASAAAEHPDELSTMTWDELRGLAARGVEIGSHGARHAHLPRLAREEIRHELTESRRRIEAELGRPCRLVAYPYGEHDGRCREEARLAGYDLAFAVPPFGAPADELRADRFALPRVGLFRNSNRLRTGLKASLAMRRLAAAA
jgi:peptidoglycan/xylan/chitin deacetylase (PgdA/CDA1 family)